MATFTPPTPEQAQEAEKLVDLSTQFFADGNTLKNIKGLTNEHMDAVYSAAHTLYENAKYEKALTMFQFLCVYDHLKKKHWVGLGACQQMLKNYPKAIDAYSFATLLDLEDPRPPLYAADCHLQLGNLTSAASALTAATEWAGSKPEYAGIRDRAQTMLGIIKDRAAQQEKAAAN
jgi:type III secretion system low calcium response chaperone LcrH/SycD